MYSSFAENTLVKEFAILDNGMEYLKICVTES